MLGHKKQPGGLRSISITGATATRRGKFEPEELINGVKKLYWLDDMKCKGDERTLIECEHREIGDHNCGRRERAGVECIGLWLQTLK